MIDGIIILAGGTVEGSIKANDVTVSGGRVSGGIILEEPLAILEPEGGKIVSFAPADDAAKYAAVCGPDGVPAKHIVIGPRVRGEYQLDKTAVTLPVGSSAQLKLIGPDGSAASARWRSSDEAAASVDADGVVTACRYGKATVSAETADGAKYDCTVRTLFSDAADSSKYYYKAICWAADHKPPIANGFGGAYFGVGKRAVRKDAVFFLYKMAGQPKVPDEELAALDPLFSDVSGLNKSLRSAVAWAYRKGIAKGYGRGEFKGQFGILKELTRREALIMIWRSIGKPAPGSSGIAAARSFLDVSGRYEESSDSFKAVAWAAENGVAKGYTTKASSLPEEYKDVPIPCFGCDFACKREDVIVFLYRTAEILKKGR